MLLQHVLSGKAGDQRFQVCQRLVVQVSRHIHEAAQNCLELAVMQQVNDIPHQAAQQIGAGDARRIGIGMAVLAAGHQFLAVQALQCGLHRTQGRLADGGNALADGLGIQMRLLPEGFQHTQLQFAQRVGQHIR